MNDFDDRIEREIAISAPAAKVWDLVSRPGWFINNGALIEHEVRRDGDVDIVHDPAHGSFPVRTVELDPPRYAAFRWLSSEPADGPDEPGTLVEFWITEGADGGVTLRVAESGFSTLGGSEADRRRRVEENTEGWEQELEVARTHFDPLIVQRSVFINAPLERVWALISDPRKFEQWYAFGGADFDLREGAAMTLRWEEHGTYRGRIESVDAPNRLSFRLAAAADSEPMDRASTSISMSLEPYGEGCVLRVTHAGFDQLESHLIGDTNVDTESAGWEGALATLASLSQQRLSDGVRS